MPDLVNICEQISVSVMRKCVRAPHKNTFMTGAEAEQDVEGESN